MNTYVNILSFGILALFLVGIVFLYLSYAKLTSPVQIKARSFISEHKFFIVGFVALASLIGSFIFSHVFLLEPCELCWVQRIGYILSIFTAMTALFGFNRAKCNQILVILIGVIGLVAIYQYSTQIGLSPDLLNCQIESVSCSAVSFNQFGFITIPFMSIIISLFCMITLSFKKSY